MTAPFSFFAAAGYPFGRVPQKQVRVSRPVTIYDPFYDPFRPTLAAAPATKILQ
jgi:hypothetical protein